MAELSIHNVSSVAVEVVRWEGWSTISLEFTNDKGNNDEVTIFLSGDKTLTAILETLAGVSTDISSYPVE